jgi:hypothetical protein
MGLALIDIETLDKLFEEISELKKTVSEFNKMKKLPGGENEWEYFTLDEVLSLLKITKKSWYKSYKKTSPTVIPYTQYGDKIWIKKNDLNKFLEIRRLS